jgi:hypothetical protein
MIIYTIAAGRPPVLSFRISVHQPQAARRPLGGHGNENG